MGFGARTYLSDDETVAKVGHPDLPPHPPIGEQDGSRFARMPNHAMRLHEWGTRSIGLTLCMGHPPHLSEDGAPGTITPD
jgi:hypothetical protein